MITRTSLKNILVWVLVLALMLPLIPAVTHADTYGFSEMYVKTDSAPSPTKRRRSSGTLNTVIRSRWTGPMLATMVGLNWCGALWATALSRPATW